MFFRNKSRRNLRSSVGSCSRISFIHFKTDHSCCWVSLGHWGKYYLPAKVIEDIVTISFSLKGYALRRSHFYYRTSNDNEVDFVTRAGRKVTFLIIVSVYSFLNDEVIVSLEKSNQMQSNKLALTVLHIIGGAYRQNA